MERKRRLSISARLNIEKVVKLKTNVDLDICSDEFEIYLPSNSKYAIKASLSNTNHGVYFEGSLTPSICVYEDELEIIIKLDYFYYYGSPESFRLEEYTFRFSLNGNLLTERYYYI
jgi:hypothetical protein